MITKQTITIRNGIKNNPADRPDFDCLKVVVSPDDPLLSGVRANASHITGNLNPHSANGAMIRSSALVSADNLIGLIAEHACYQVLKDQFGESRVLKPSSQSSQNQIDIMLSNNMTIEVRSSCIRNGIEFALFSLNRNRDQYIDVIGPYFNETYKQYEEIKDYYMRVIYAEETSSVYSRILSGESVELYITGGVTRQMLSENGKNKTMLASGDYKIKSKGVYRVIPMSESLDYPDFISKITDDLNCR